MNKNIFIVLIIILSLLSCKLFQSDSENSKPIASFVVTPSTGNIETIFTFDASECTDEEDTTDDLMVRWDWEDDGDYDSDWNKNKIATHQFDSIGEETIRLQVKDTNGSNVSTTKSISISNSSPTASFTCTPNNGTTATIFTFDASECSDGEDEDDSLRVRWDWNNDGIWDTGHSPLKTINHRFESVKLHTVKLEVQDFGGLIDTFTKSIYISIADGAQIVQDVILTEDLECSDYNSSALDILTSGVNLDLGGYSIINTSANPEKYGILVESNNITIKNGTIDGFLFGIEVTNSLNVTIEDVKIINMEIVDPDTFVFGISARGSQDVYINNCQFELPKTAHKEAIISYGSIINVENMEFNGGSVGVNFSYGNSCGSGSQSTYNGGVVKNSTFNDADIAGVLVACSNNALIIGNDFNRCEVGVQAYGPNFGSIKNLIIESNNMIDGWVGIFFMGVTESMIYNNNIKTQWLGITLEQDHECFVGNNNTGCFYSINNTISNNVVTGSVLDLHHQELCVGNTWINNTCQTKEGDEIPDCTN